MNSDEPLPSWSQGDAKSAILEFVEFVTELGASYVPPPERVTPIRNAYGNSRHSRVDACRTSVTLPARLGRRAAWVFCSVVALRI